MERLRAEADATAKEKEAKAAAKAAGSGSSRSSGKKQPSAQPRVRIVWFVCDASGKEVKHFPYSQEAEARAEAQQMTTSSGRTHFVKTGDIPA